MLTGVPPLVICQSCGHLSFWQLCRNCGKPSHCESQTSLLPDTLGEITARHATGGEVPSGRLEGCNSISRKMKETDIVWEFLGSITRKIHQDRARRVLHRADRNNGFRVDAGETKAQRGRRGNGWYAFISFEMGGLSPYFQRLKVVNPLRFKPPLHRDLDRLANSLLRHRTGSKRVCRPRAWY